MSGIRLNPPPAARTGSISLGGAPPYHVRRVYPPGHQLPHRSNADPSLLVTLNGGFQQSRSSGLWLSNWPRAEINAL
jgi:hypothetical protein